MFPLHHLLSSLPWFLGVAEIVVVVAILEDEDVDPLEVDIILMEVDKVPLNKDIDNVGTVDTVIIFLRSAGRNLDDLSEHNYLILILLPCVVPLMSLYLLFLILLPLYCRRGV